MDNPKVETINGSLGKCVKLNSLQIGHLIHFTIFAILCCSWVLWIREVRQYLVRRIFASCPDVFKRKSRRVCIATGGSIPVAEIALQSRTQHDRTVQSSSHGTVARQSPVLICWVLCFQGIVLHVQRSSEQFWSATHQLQIRSDMKKGADARTLTAEILWKLVTPSN